MGAMGDLGAFGFWMFIAAVVVGGMWFDARKREAQQETLRRFVESGKDIDASVVEKMLTLTDEKNRKDEELKTSGIIMLFVAPGLYVFGYFMQSIAQELLTIMTGVALMVAFIGVGLYVAGRLAERRYDNDKG